MPITRKNPPFRVGGKIFSTSVTSVWVEVVKKKFPQMNEENDLLKEEGMHAGATADKFAFASALRNAQTPHEQKLWEFLRTKPNGFKFRRQHPFRHYILDFYCHSAKLVIELDGKQHKSNLEYDNDRTEIVGRYGLKVIRFENFEVDDNFNKVKKRILKELE